MLCLRLYDDVDNAFGDGDGLDDLHPVEVLCCFGCRGGECYHLLGGGIGREEHVEAYFAVELHAELHACLHEILLFVLRPAGVANAAFATQCFPEFFGDVRGEGSAEDDHWLVL